LSSGTWGDDTIIDWEDGVDKINLSGTNLDVNTLILGSNSNGEVVLGDNSFFTNSMTFYGITSGITADDIIFA
jgi:hypothetical protein